jgi:hypothetical protein
MISSPASINLDIRGYPTYNPQSGTPSLITNSGDNIIYTPTLGNRLRLKWIGLRTPKNNTPDVEIIIKIGSANIYQWYLTKLDIFSHATIREGNINESLILNLSNDSNVYINFDLEEFT